VVEPMGLAARASAAGAVAAEEFGAFAVGLEAALVELTGLSPQSAARLLELMVRFLRFVEQGWGPRDVRDIRPEHVRDFVFAPLGSPDGPREASAATAHLRRSAVRLLFRLARLQGLVDGDPTLDLVLPRRSSAGLRALTDDEVALCRSSSQATLRETRQPAAWALAEATARTSEIPRVRIADLDLDTATVWIAGGAKTAPRHGTLTSWGVLALERRLHTLNVAAGSSTPVVYEGDVGAASAHASSCVAVTGVLRRAGLGLEPDVRPLSVAAWAGTKVFEQTGKIDSVARALGTRSLDRTAALIGWDWHTDAEPGDQG
jgi:integrase